MILIKRVKHSLLEQGSVVIGRTIGSQVRFSKWHEAVRLTDPLVEIAVVDNQEVRVLPLAKLSQVIAVLRLNGIEVELGEGL